MKDYTYKKIAEELNLSPKTVSRALSGKEGVSKRTRGRVAECAEKHKTKMSGQNIMILTRTDVSLFWNSVLSGVSEILNEHYNVVLHFANEGKGGDEQLAPLPECAGILVLSVYSERFLRRYIETGVPMVFLDTGISDSDRAFMRGDVVISEGLFSVEVLTRHLIAQGMKHIGFIGDITYCRTIRDRFEGYLLGLKSADITPDYGIIASKRMPEKYYLKFEVQEALAGFAFIPEAVVCANDDIALHLIKCLTDRGIRVPEDVAVTGYDNLEALIEQIPPFLSTVNVPHFELGKRLARQLIWRIEFKNAPKEIVMLRGEVIIRSSSAKFPKR